jgi:hypothetical protein
MSKKSDLFLKKTVGDDFLESLVKFDLFKPGTRSVVDHEEISTALQIVPRVLLQFLISSLSSMNFEEGKTIDLPCGVGAQLEVTKHERDVYSGRVLENSHVIVDFKYRSIPGIGLILLSAFELYDVSTLSDSAQPGVATDVSSQVEKLIDERMHLHSMIHAVVDKKMSERDAVKDLILARMTDKLKSDKIATQIQQVKDISTTSVPMEDPYFRGMANGIAVADSIVNDREPDFVQAPDKKEPGSGGLIKRSDLQKMADKKKPAILNFMDKIEKKKLKKAEFSIVMAKGEIVDCPDCKKAIFNDTKFSACVCFGDSKTVQLKKTADGFKISFPPSWDPEDMQMLLEILWRKNGKS